MYVSPGDLDSTSLFQGDIISNVQFLGAINFNSIQHHVPLSGGQEPPSWTVAVPPRIGQTIVVSHSCEVALENEVKVTSIILAPLRDVDKATPPEKLEELIASNLIDKDSESSYLKYFYLEASDELDFAKGAVADFSKIFSVRKNSYKFLLGKKVLQLEEDIRKRMSLKLALYFHREE